MQGGCIYLQVLVQMYLRGMDTRALSEQTGMSYPTLRRKLRGVTPLGLDEALRIRGALQCDMPLERLFARKEDVHGA